MSEKEPIKDKIDSASHSGKHSTLRRLEAARVKFDEWRNQRTLANEAGHKSFPFAGTPEQITFFFQEYEDGKDEEIEVFNPDWIGDVAKTNKVYNDSVSETEDSRLKPD